MLVSELLNDKDNTYPPFCFSIRSILMTSQGERKYKRAVSCLNPYEIFRKLFNLCKKYIHTNPAIFNIAHLSYVLRKEKQILPWLWRHWLLNIQDGGRLISLSYLCPLIFQKLGILSKI